jgi:molybdopterin-guanine dinucleotide biosynthesis adapter protein
MIPVVAIVGRSGSGKTVLMEKLIGEMKARGYKVAAVKHAHQKIDMDAPGKDTWRFSQAGSKATVIASPELITIFRNTKADPGLEDVVRVLGQGYDIILAEGFKETKYPKIEVHEGKETAPLFKESDLIAIVSDDKIKFKIPRFRRDDAEGIADFIEKDVIDSADSDISVTVNSKTIFLMPFVKDIISRSILAMLSTLKNVGIIRNVVILIRNKT